MSLMTPASSAEGKALWSAFLERIAEAGAEVGCGAPGGCEPWFRGHARSTHSLLPSLFRNFADPDGRDAPRIRDIESDLYWEFSARARELHGVIESDWDILFAMQHHGTPTRLLDWTEVLGVAVYFAVLGVDANQGVDGAGRPLPPPCVWVLNPYRLNECSEWGADLIYPPNLGWLEGRKEWEGTYFGYSDLLTEGGLGWDWPVAIYPRQRSARIHAQRGWFTIHGDKLLAIEALSDWRKYLRKVELPWAALTAARDFLAVAGLDHYALFPDLQNLSLHLREKHGLTGRTPAPAPAAVPVRGSSGGSRRRTRG